MSTVPSTIRVVEELAALSLTTDLASGVPFEKGLRRCLVGEAFGRELGLSESDRRGVFQAVLLRGIGCTSHSSENAAMLVDNFAFQAMSRALPSSCSGSSRTPVVGPRATRSGCEVRRALGSLLGLDVVAVFGLDEVNERWDGSGIPRPRRRPVPEMPSRRHSCGLYFVGVHFLRKRKSALLKGAGEDASLVAGQIAESSAA